MWNRVVVGFLPLRDLRDLRSANAEDFKKSPPRLSKMAEAQKLYAEAADLVPLMQGTTDPDTSKKLVGKKPEPNVALAAAGLGMHRGVYKNAQRAMSELNNAYAGKIPASVQKNPKAAKEWKDKFARYDALTKPSLSRSESLTAFVETVGSGMKKAGSFVGELVTPVAAAERGAVEAKPAAAKVEAAKAPVAKVEAAKAPVGKGAKVKAAKEAKAAAEAQAAKDAPAAARSPAPWFACFLPCWQPAQTRAA